MFAAVEDLWADSFSSALLSTVVIFGGIVFAVFLAFGTNTGQGLHWAVKEYSQCCRCVQRHYYRLLGLHVPHGSIQRDVGIQNDHHG